jgi:hypothetical protein
VPTEETGSAAPSLESILTQPERYTVSGLWAEAESLARDGRHREAVRALYLAVLALLHRSNLIRFERTRTNGEYVHQLRPRTELHRPFASLTRRFEVQWYSERICLADDYQACRDIAEDLRAAVDS